MKRILLFFVCMSLFFVVQAKVSANPISQVKKILNNDKHKNHVKLYLSNFFYAEVTRRSDMIGAITPVALFQIWGQVGLGYERSINKRLSVEASHNRWNDTKFFRGGLRYNTIITDFNYTPAKIGFHSRANLQFYDVGAFYSLISTQRHKLKSGIALSFQRGYSGYVDSVHNYGGPYPHYEGYIHFEYKEYWGFTPSISYDLTFLKQWLCIGADIRARRYFNYGNYTQVDFGLHAGVNF